MIVNSDNKAVYPQFSAQEKFYEAWYLKLNLPKDHLALWIRFLLLNTPTKKQGTVWAICFLNQKEKIFTKHTRDIKSLGTDILLNNDASIVNIDNNSLGYDHTTGDIQCEDRILWNLSFVPDEEFTFHYAPSLLKRFISSKASSPNMDTRFSGKLIVNGKEFDCNNSPGIQGHYYGKQYAHRWAWAHCNAFDHANNHAVFEIIDVKTAALAPSLKSACIKYQNKNYVIHDVWSLLFTSSHYKKGSWDFICQSENLMFKINIQTEEDHVIDVEYRDTDSSSLLCHNTKLACSTLSVYRNNELENMFVSSHTTAFEIVDRI